MHLGVGHLAASPEGTRRRNKGHQEWWRPVVSGLAGRPPRSDATISSADSATPIVLLERHRRSRRAGRGPARMEAEARITGFWVRQLGNLVSQRQTERLPDPIG